MTYCSLVSCCWGYFALSIQLDCWSTNTVAGGVGVLFPTSVAVTVVHAVGVVSNNMISVAVSIISGLVAGGGCGGGTATVTAAASGDDDDDDDGDDDDA